MDARIDPADVFVIEPGDTHIIRNAGGSARAALRDIIVSHHFLGTKEVYIVKYPPVLLQTRTLPSAVSREDQRYWRGLDYGYAFHDFKCPFRAAREDWWFVQTHPAIADDIIIIHAFIFNPANGKLGEVDPQGAAGEPAGSQLNPPAPDPAPVVEEPVADSSAKKAAKMPAKKAIRKETKKTARTAPPEVTPGRKRKAATMYYGWSDEENSGPGKTWGSLHAVISRARINWR
ncbi:hypothetical protein VP1G_06288 [Cytospora mali]|uniref:Uncharacterized protein n=1 Tax=Cytospora mali TaxID=578113 RepID=A0A194V500_CYTMA|nr:hypothetical protein VP1G_06288 [Valsa mali var. pyri (nom. inval.)]